MIGILRVWSYFLGEVWLGWI